MYSNDRTGSNFLPYEAETGARDEVERREKRWSVSITGTFPFRPPGRSFVPGDLLLPNEMCIIWHRDHGGSNRGCILLFGMPGR